MAGALEDAISAALGARLDALQRHALVHEDLADLQLVHVGALVVLGVRDGGLEALADGHGRGLGAEVQDVERRRDVLAPDLVSHEADLLGRDADALGVGEDFHRRFLYRPGAQRRAFLSA